jgi:hypothetical protein
VYLLYIVVCPFSVDRCVVCPSSIYGFWLPFWYLQTFLKETFNVKVNTSSSAWCLLVMQSSIVWQWQQSDLLVAPPVINHINISHEYQGLLCLENEITENQLNYLKPCTPPFKPSIFDMYWPCPVTFCIIFSDGNSWNQLDNWKFILVKSVVFTTSGTYPWSFVTHIPWRSTKWWPQLNNYQLFFLVRIHNMVHICWSEFWTQRQKHTRHALFCFTMKTHIFFILYCIFLDNLTSEKSSELFNSSAI